MCVFSSPFFVCSILLLPLALKAALWTCHSEPVVFEYIPEEVCGIGRTSSVAVLYLAYIYYLLCVGIYGKML